jgi:hypothetical protein
MRHYVSILSHINTVRLGRFPAASVDVELDDDEDKQVSAV